MVCRIRICANAKWITNASCLHRNDEICFVISYSCFNEVIPLLLVFLLTMFVHSSGKIIKCTFSCFWYGYHVFCIEFSCDVFTLWNHSLIDLVHQELSLADQLSKLKVWCLQFASFSYILSCGTYRKLFSWTVPNLWLFRTWKSA